MIRLATALMILSSVSSARGDDFFENRVRPVLAEHCYSCHGPKKQKLGLRLDRADGFRADDGSGSVIVPGKPDESRLVLSVRREGDHPMPPDGKLTPAEVQALAEWVRLGAKWPEEKKHVVADPKGHWSFKPVQAPTVPNVTDGDWPRSDIDRFLLAKLEEAKLKPSPDADKRMWIRRVFFDLVGLPPTPEEVENFVKDESLEAHAKVVDDLLKRPQFGERWGRHWLDLARYAENRTAGDQTPYRGAYLYRDWVIKSFNDDLPYDQFLLKQIAADRLNRAESHADLAALGFLTLGRKLNDDEQDVIDDRIDVIFRATQGLTVSCARCHDHKYDPIPTADYYSIYGVFSGAVEEEVPLIRSSQERAAHLAFAAEARSRSRSFRRFVSEERRRLLGVPTDRAAQYLLTAKDEPADGEKPPEELKSVILERYREFLKNTKNEHHPIMGPWHAFTELGGDDFAKEAKSLARKFADNDDPEKPLNPFVAALFKGKSPESLDQVAERYARLFQIVHKKWTRKMQLADKQDLTPPTELEDEDEEQIRKLFFGDDRPLDINDGDFREMLSEDKIPQFEALQNAITEWENSPDAPPFARVVRDPEDPAEPVVFIRGRADRPGDAVPRQFLSLIAGEEREPFGDGSGRLDLAKAIAAKDNPLTARVYANRVWQHLMGAGLVATPSDFGSRSDPPSHPELLDHLANFLVAGNWSTKALIREIVLSRAYRQSSAGRDDLTKADPRNRLLGRMNRKRMEAEPFRDGLLAVAGLLDRTLGGKSVPVDQSNDSKRRAVYLRVERGNLPGLFEAFDFANADLHTPTRFETVVPQQALHLLNSPFVAECARSLAARPTKDIADDGWIDEVYRTTLGRPATPEEVATGKRFLADAALLKNLGPKPRVSPWKYGFGRWSVEKKAIDFTELTHFQDEQWRVGGDFPDAKLGYLHLSRDGGHPAPDSTMLTIRRWVAPRDAEVEIHGELSHQTDDQDEQSDGVRGRVFGPGGELLSVTATRGAAKTESKVRVKAGEVIDFAVDCLKSDRSDTFSWKVSLTIRQTDGSELGYHSDADFRGPPEKGSPPLTPREKFAQILLMSNEFVYVD